MTSYDILICGIGGQGVISLGTTLKLAALAEGLSVFGAERRGGAQREGIVTSNVRYRGYSSRETADERARAVSGLIPIAGADMMIAMEPLEALRHAKYLHEGSVVIVNDFPLIPVSVRMGQCEYPSSESIYVRLREFSPRVHVAPIDEISKREFNSLRQINTILLGMAMELGDIPLSESALLSTIESRFPDFKKNERAFRLGREIASEKARD